MLHSDKEILIISRATVSAFVAYFCTSAAMKMKSIIRRSSEVAVVS